MITGSSIPTDTWVKSSWEDYLQTLDHIHNDKAKSYYYEGQYKIEMAPIGSDHAKDHHIIFFAVTLYAVSRTIEINGLDNCSYRKTGYREAQPDASYYIGNQADAISCGTSIINLDQYPAPDLVIEIAKTTLADDLGNKRLLYEELGVSEYWVVDVEKAQVIAFKVKNKGSQRIETSQVLPKLNISLLSQALQKSRQVNHSQVGRWLMTEFQKLN